MLFFNYILYKICVQLITLCVFYVIVIIVMFTELPLCVLDPLFMNNIAVNSVTREKDFIVILIQ